MENTITIEKGLAAHFNQSAGSSRPGVAWTIRISGARAGTVIVRTYYSSDPPQQSEQQALANKAMHFVQEKLEQGWIPPQPTDFLEAE